MTWSKCSSFFLEMNTQKWKNMNGRNVFFSEVCMALVLQPEKRYQSLPLQSYGTKSRHDESKSDGFIILYIHTTAIQTVYMARNHGCCCVLDRNHLIKTMKCMYSRDTTDNEMIIECCAVRFLHREWLCNDLLLKTYDWKLKLNIIRWQCKLGLIQLNTNESYWIQMNQNVFIWI